MSRLTIGSKTSAFNRSFAGLLNSYYGLSDAFAASDTQMISTAGQKLNLSVDSIRFDQFKADTSIVQTAVSLAQSMQAEIAGMNGEKTMEQKKREFNMITDQLYSLIRTVRYDGSTIFHMRCPAAFPDSSEAYWLSPVNKFVNPYLGKNHPVYKDKMLESGEIKRQYTFYCTGERMMKKILLFILLVWANSVDAQNKFSISGYVKDSLSSESLIGATVSFNGQQKGVSSNGYGFYSITLPEGHYIITASYVGYRSKNIEINLNENVNLQFSDQSAHSCQ